MGDPRTGAPIENFASDLEDGMAIGFLLSVCAPDTVRTPSKDLEERLEQVDAAGKYNSFKLLSQHAIIEGQADVLAGFVAQLFLARPALATRPGSSLVMHLRLLERICTDGLEALASADNDGACLVCLCGDFEAQWTEISLAVQTAHEAIQAMRNLRD